MLSQFLTAEQKESQEQALKDKDGQSSNNEQSLPEAPATGSQESAESAGSTSSSPPQNLNKDDSEGPSQTTAKHSSETGPSDESEQEAAKASKEEYKKVKVASIDALLKARQDLVNVLRPRVRRPFDVSLQGVESGQIEAVIKARLGQVRAAFVLKA